MKAKTYIFGADNHHTHEKAIEGGHDPAAWSCFLQALDIVKPDGFGHIGDFLECDSVSHWQWKRRKRPPLEYILPPVEAEKKVAHTVMNDLNRRLDKVKCDDRFFLQGNHEKWLDDFVEEHPYFEGRFDTKAMIPLDGWTYLPYGEYHQVGRLHLTHGGHFTGENHARKTALSLGACCVYGHFHSHQVAKIRRLDGMLGAWSLPCLCLLKKKFLRGRPVDWSHGFAIAHFEPSGEFHLEVVEIFNGRCFVYGRRVEAK